MNASAQETRVRDDEPKAGDWLLGKWRLDRLLGTGGMSSVFSATHRNGSRVAIKLLAPGLRANANVERRFLREGYIANRVEHPGAVRVLDDGRDGNRTFLVMELLHGANLETLRKARGGTLTPSEAVWVARNVLLVLQAAQSANVVHRDVKPQNLFLTVSGELKLLDFGVASLRGVPGFTTLTDSAGQPGTPGFMAPEQVRGHHETVGPATDIWGLGATLFRLLSGQTVHLAATAGEMMVATATERPRSLASVRPGLPVQLTKVVDRALYLEPGERWASASEMLAALDRASTTFPVLTHPALPPELSQEEVTWDTDFEGGSDGARDIDGPQLAEGQQTPIEIGSFRRAVLLFSALTLGALGIRYVWNAETEPTASTGGIRATGAAELSTTTARGVNTADAAPVPSVSAPVSSVSQVVMPTPSAGGSASDGVGKAPPVVAPKPEPPKRSSRPSRGSPKSERDLLKRRL